MEPKPPGQGPHNHDKPQQSKVSEWLTPPSHSGIGRTILEIEADLRALEEQKTKAVEGASDLYELQQTLVRLVQDEAEDNRRFREKGKTFSLSGESSFFQNGLFSVNEILTRISKSTNAVETIEQILREIATLGLANALKKYGLFNTLQRLLRSELVRQKGGTDIE